MSAPLVAGDLWMRVSEQRVTRLIVVISASDLRRQEEVYVSRALSWERTARDVVYQLQRSNVLRTLQACPFVIVLLDTDGAILFRGGEDARATFFADLHRDLGRRTRRP